MHGCAAAHASWLSFAGVYALAPADLQHALSHLPRAEMSPLHALLQGGGRAGSQATERRRFLEALARCCQVREQ